MSLERLKRSILLKSSDLENDGCVDPGNHGYSRGDRFGRISPGVNRRNCRIMAAIEELIAEGLVEEDRCNLYQTTGWHCIDCVEAGRKVYDRRKCGCEEKP